MSSRVKNYGDDGHDDDSYVRLGDSSISPMHAERDALSRRLAERYCDRHGVECGWYHGEWQLLKSLGIVSTSAVHTRHLRALLQVALQGLTRPARILLSGSTDDSLLRIVRAGAGRHMISVVALDICATPLKLMRASAISRELDFGVIRANILEYEDEQGYDLILTHAFMGNFSVPEREALAAKWFSLLRPGGRMATIQRIRPEGTPAVIGFSAAQTEAFVQAALELGAGRGLDDLPRVERVARTFAEKKRTFTITSRAQFEAMFTAAGFELTYLQYDALPILPGLSGPSVPSGGEYALLVAGKNTVRP